MLRGFTRKKVNSYTLGELLKEIRKEGRINLSELSRETKVPVKYLVMIEDGRYESLPPDVYVKGFLKSYAEYLGVDPKKLIKLYQKEKDIKNNLRKNGRLEDSTVKLVKAPRLVITPKVFAVSLIVLAVIGGFIYLYKEIGRFASTPRLVITQPTGDQSIEGNSITVVGFTDRDSKLTINDQPVLVDDDGKFKENILLQEGVNTITITAVNRFDKKASETLNVKSNYKVDIAARDQGREETASNDEGRISGEQDARKRVELTVRVNELPTWLSVEADGNLVYSGTMLPGSVRDFKAEEEIRITSGKANQTLIRVNGRDEKVLADTPGIVRDVVFTPND